MLLYNLVLYLTVSFFGIISNVLLLITFIKDPLKCFRNSATYLVMNLSISDLLTCLFYPFFLERIFVAGFDMSFLPSCFGLASFVSIALISIDRFLIVAYPFRHRQWTKKKPMLLWSTVIWVIAFILPILRHFYGEPVKKYAMKYFSLFLVVLSLVMHAFTYGKFKKHSTTIGQQNSTEGRAREIRIMKEKKFLKTIILIAAIALICSVPSLIYFQLEDYQLLTHTVLDKIVTLIFNVNFAINPFIYILRLPNYRKTFHVIHCKKLQTITYGLRDVAEMDASNL